jgi:hypothetical protein
MFIGLCLERSGPNFVFLIRGGFHSSGLSSNALSRFCQKYAGLRVHFLPAGDTRAWRPIAKLPPTSRAGRASDGGGPGRGRQGAFPGPTVVSSVELGRRCDQAGGRLGCRAAITVPTRIFAPRNAQVGERLLQGSFLCPEGTALLRLSALSGGNSARRTTSRSLPAPRRFYRGVLPKVV